MIQLGIYKREQLLGTSRRFRSPRRKPISVTLYPEIVHSGDPAADEALEKILLDFSNGRTFKRTQRHRFADFDRTTIRMVRDLGASLGHLQVHDVAVSDGRTAVDFFHQLADLPGLEFVASDGSPDVTVVHDPKGRFVVVLDAGTNEVLQAVRPPFVFNIPNPGRRALLYPINRAFRETLLRRQVPGLLARWRDGDPSIRVTSIRLIAPDCLRLIESDPRFTFERYDVLKPATRPFDVVRAMNILNRGYFTDAEMLKALRHVHASLHDGGLFITGSNQDAGSGVNGAVYRRVGASFRSQWVSGSGSAADHWIERVEVPFVG